MNTKKLTKLLALYLPYILLGLVATNFGEAWRLAEGKELGERIMSMMGTLPAAFANPLPSLHPLDLLIGISCGAGLRLAVYLRSKNAKKYRHGMEYGSARWGTAKDIEPFQAPKFEDNIILTKTERLMMSNRPSDPKNARNKNVLIVGGSGSGKTRFWLKPNLLQMHSSYVVTDPKGSIVVECGNALLKNGYKLKILNTINFSKSMHYNPFSYVHSEKDILKLVTTLMTNTKGDGSGGDPFWEKSERLLLTALIAYLHYEAPKEEQNFSTLLEMLNTMQVSEDDEDFQNPVDLLFEDLAKRKPNSFAGRQYKLYKLAAGKTAKSILISCGARLAPFDIQELRDRTMYDELELDMLGDRKTALFLIMSDTDSTFNFLISMVYTQLFNLLCDKADDKYGGKLPVHVRCLIDECANIGQIPNLEKLVATIRSREISACLVLQARSQLKAIYKDNADTIVGNMDSQIFLGGSEPTTLKELSETLGKETIDSFNTSDTRGNSPSYGTSFQKLGHDAGREGELIFRLVYQQAGCKKSFSRLWLSSMEDSAIREGFANLKPSTEYDALYQAALCRERADWMVGINASRLFSCLYGQPLAVGRVMTPVLAMTVVREAAIAAFVPQKFYTVELELTSGCTASSRRISEKDTAENLLAECRKEMISTIQKVTRKEKSENPPLLYDLTTLQRDANRLLGYSAQQTLNYVQSLYEKKLTTYPRTDSCYITDDDEEMLAGLADELEEFLGIAADTADSAVPRTRCTVNRDKVTDHHAILPTRSMLQADLDALPTGERNVLKLIIARTLMAVSKPYRYLETMLTTECAGEEFTAKGKEILDEGWKAVERKVLADILNRKQEFTTLPTMEESECAILNAEMKEGKTTPPKHFTEDTLLHSMEMASTDSMPEGVERQGIGTPATRAATIEKLVQKGFLERKGEKKTKILLPTDKGKALITVMPEEIQSLEMTADWETKLLRIERGEMEPEEFMTEIKDMISSLVNTTEAMKGANVLMKNKIVGVCPNCGANVVEREKGWFCDNKPCRFVLWKDNAFFKRLGKRLDSHVADKLLRDGRVRLKDCKSAKGKTYNATVLLSTEADGRSKFSLEFEGGR